MEVGLGGVFHKMTEMEVGLGGVFYEMTEMEVGLGCLVSMPQQIIPITCTTCIISLTSHHIGNAPRHRPGQSSNKFFRVKRTPRRKRRRRRSCPTPWLCKIRTSDSRHDFEEGDSMWHYTCLFVRFYVRDVRTNTVKFIFVLRSVYDSVARSQAEKLAEKLEKTNKMLQAAQARAEDEH